MGGAFAAATLRKVQVKSFGRRVGREVGGRLSTAAAAHVHDGTPFPVLEKREEAASHVDYSTAVDLNHIRHIRYLVEE